MTITVYQARRIVTMNPAQPVATHVAVRDGIVLAVGDAERASSWGAGRLDTQFRDHVLMPGLVEGHSHMTEGATWRNLYVGYFDRTDPDGKVWRGIDSIDALLARLREANARLNDPGTPLVAWGFDPIYFGERRVNRADLDSVSRERPIAVTHASGHITNANSAALALAGLLRAGIDHPGIALGGDGLPTGELKGPDAMTPVLEKVGLDRNAMTTDEQGARAFSRLCVRKGVTTATDLASPMPDEAVEMLLRLTAEPSFATRLVPLIRIQAQTGAQVVARAQQLARRATDKFRLGRIKIHADGSIQGFSARHRPPGHFNGAPQGLWYIAPETLREAYVAALRAGIAVHTHTNGDEAIELAIETMAQALRVAPAFDHRFTLQHCQTATSAQMRRMKALGLCANLFANHHFYWGEAHRSMTLGPDRAERMNACRTAGDIGLPYAIHSDAPVTPLGPLFTAWCAVNRLTHTGRVLGEYERIGVMEALRAITLGPAYTLHLDHEVGSIEVGKRADFAVLEEDPTEVDPLRLKDIPVWGVVFGGQPQAAGAV